MEKSLFIPLDFTLDKGWNFGNVVSVPNTNVIERIIFLSFPLFGIHAKLFPWFIEREDLKRIFASTVNCFD